MASHQQILIIAPAWVGDLVMSQTLLKQLWVRYGNDCVIDMLVPDWALDLVKRMPEVRQAYANHLAHGEFSLVKRWRLAYELRLRQYTQVIVLPNSWKSALIPFFSGIKQRTGFLGEMRYGLLNNYYRLDKQQLPLMIDRFAALANEGNKVDAPQWPQLSVQVANQQSLLSKLGLNGNLPIVCLCPAAEYGPAKRWPAAHFAQLAMRLRIAGYQIWLLGGAKDRGLAEEIVSLVPNIDNLYNLCGVTTLVDVVDLLALAKAVVSNDSGLMHIACAVNVPVIALYGSSSPHFTPPLSTTARILQLNLPCSPCFARTCKFGHYNCLWQLTPAAVLAELSQFLPNLGTIPLNIIKRP